MSEFQYILDLHSAVHLNNIVFIVKMLVILLSKFGDLVLPLLYHDNTFLHFQSVSSAFIFRYPLDVARRKMQLAIMLREPQHNRFVVLVSHKLNL